MNFQLGDRPKVLNNIFKSNKLLIGESRFEQYHFSINQDIHVFYVFCTFLKDNDSNPITDLADEEWKCSTCQDLVVYMFKLLCCKSQEEGQPYGYTTKYKAITLEDKKNYTPGRWINLLTLPKTLPF